MSVTFISIAVIGCEITAMVETARSVRACGHPAERGPFCPQCGKPKWEMRAVDLNDEWDKRLAGVGLKLVTTGYGADARVFAGLVVEVGPGGARALAVSSLADAAVMVRAGLERLELWDGRLFGVWAVGYCS